MFDLKTLVTLGDIPPEVPVTPQLEPSMAGLFLRVVLTLAVIIFLTYIVLRMVKRQQSIQQKISNERKGWVRVYDYQGLGTNRGLYLVELFSGVCVLGASENGITLLKEIPEDSEEWLALKDNLDLPEEVIPPGLSDFLKNTAGLFHKNRNTPKSFAQELKENLTDQVNGQLDRTRRLSQRINGRKDDGE
ncbi:MAG: flagellar biosynthetic protein FliO [Clostridia bacterium]|jgi:flagellar biogenesis protein FliO|nr:flagellar biosynthetic protein FliO [Clostridia bacterium]